MIKLIAAISDDGFIGTDNNELPWFLPEDLKHFKSTTMGEILVMGRKTFESLNSVPLGGRETAVITRGYKKKKAEKGLKFFPTLESCLNFYKDRTIWIAGGGMLYETALPYVEEMLITKVHMNVGHGIRFPRIDTNLWKCECTIGGESSTGILYNFLTYKKNKS